MISPPPRQVRPLALVRRTITVGAVLAWEAAWAAHALLISRLRRRPVATSVILARAAAASCERLNGALVKAAQLLGSRHDLFRGEVVDEFRRLHDRVRPAATAAVVATIENEFGCPLGDLFASFEISPCASGSIAQVHRARLRADGREVAVKVVRPAVRDAILIDTQLLRLGAAALERLPLARNLALAECASEIAGAISRQLDLRREAEIYRRLRELFPPSPTLEIPAAHLTLSRERVLITDFLAGLQRIDSPTLALPLHRRALDALLETLYRMIFEHGLFHCDLHPGNVLVAPDGRLVLLDMGMIAELSPQLRSTFREFFMSIALNRGARAAAILRETACGMTATADSGSFEEEIAVLVREASQASAGTFQVARFTASLFAIQRRYGLRGSPLFTLAILALLSFEGLAKQRYGDLDFLGLAVTMAVQGISAPRAPAGRSAARAC